MQKVYRFVSFSVPIAHSVLRLLTLSGIQCYIHSNVKFRGLHNRHRSDQFFLRIKSNTRCCVALKKSCRGVQAAEASGMGRIGDFGWI